MTKTLLTAASLATSTFLASAHYVADNEHTVRSTNTLPTVIETTGPITPPKAIKLPTDIKVSGQGFWRFIAMRDLMPVPTNVPSVKQAHGTIVVDKRNDKVYWGLQSVGWIGFSNRLRDSWITLGNPAFTNGNLHGADILPQGGRHPARIAAADNISGKVYLTDTEFQDVETLIKPGFGSYKTNNTFKPTDVTFTSGKELWVVDGYGQQRFMPAGVRPLEWQGEHYGSGKRFSMTTHGITYDKSNDDLLVSARPEGLLKRINRQDRLLTEILELPAGTLLCDVDVWGDYALAACLNGPNKTPGPLHIINLKNRTLVATIKPKEELGYEDAQHMHDAAWYVTGKGKDQEIYILFTNWNPGGIGALKLVNLVE